MTYAYVVGGAVQSTGSVPQTWRLLDGRWCSGFDLRADLWKAEGWLPLTENFATIDTSTQEYGAPVFTVGASAVTADYPAVARAAAAVNGDTLRSLLTAQIAPGSPARNAVAGNTTFIQAAKPGTAAAQASAAYDQAKALSQQNNVIILTLIRSIRLLLDALDADS